MINQNEYGVGNLANELFLIDKFYALNHIIDELNGKGLNKNQIREKCQVYSELLKAERDQLLKAIHGIL
jgi:hypothetical protein